MGRENIQKTIIKSGDSFDKESLITRAVLEYLGVENVQSKFIGRFPSAAALFPGRGGVMFEYSRIFLNKPWYLIFTCRFWHPLILHIF